MLVALLASILLLTAGGTLQRSEEEQDAGGAPETAVEQPEQERAADDQPAQETSLGFEVIPEVVRNIEPSVVAVLRDDGEGSGVIFDDEGLIVTNNHVVEGATRLEVQFVTRRARAR